MIQIWDSLTFSVSPYIWIMTTLPFQHILSSFFFFYIEVPAMHDPIPSIIKRLSVVVLLNILTEWYPVVGGIDSGNKVFDCGKITRYNFNWMKILRELTSIKYLRLTRRSISLIVFNNWRTIEITVISPTSGNIMNTYTACKTSIVLIPYPMFKIGNVSGQ